MSQSSKSGIRFRGKRAGALEQIDDHTWHKLKQAATLLRPTLPSHRDAEDRATEGLPIEIVDGLGAGLIGTVA